MAEASVHSRSGPAPSRTPLSFSMPAPMRHAERAGMPFMAQCTVNEIPYQRMHRFPAQQPRPLDLSGCFDSTHKRAFTQRPLGPRAVPSFTVGRKNELGTSSTYKQLSLNELREGQIILGDQPNTWSSVAMSSYQPPDPNDSLRGLEAPRCGMACRLPFSELTRRFATGDSEGLMPGKTGQVTGKASTQYQEMYQRHKPRGREQQMVTMGQFNDIGSSATYRTVPASDLPQQITLGDEPRHYSTATAEGFGKAPPRSWRTEGAEAAGRLAAPGNSEVEKGFKVADSSNAFNIVSNGGRLMGARNPEAYERARNANAHEAPVGRRQCPSIDPACRGPTGTMQTFDILTGAERPRERW
jgi:hypothetical protein